MGVIIAVLLRVTYLITNKRKLVIKLLNLICENNSQKTTNTMKINPNFTSKDKEHKITGQNNYEPEYIKDNIMYGTVNFFIVLNSLKRNTIC